MSCEGDYEVGYGKPPARTRFQKGQSGNPNGRPKGSVNLATVLERALLECVMVQENGRRRPISKMEVMVKQVVNQAAGGNLRAFQQVVALTGQVDRTKGEEPEEGNSEQDRQILNNLVQKMQQMRSQTPACDGTGSGHGEK